MCAVVCQGLAAVEFEDVRSECVLEDQADPVPFRRRQRIFIAAMRMNVGDLEQAGFRYLATEGYQKYEISAFCKPQKNAQHNLNYWKFGDYYGIGAGAHGKLSLSKSSNLTQIYRTQKLRQPKDYMNPTKAFISSKKIITTPDLIFEFMLNTTRLEQAIPYALFTERTGLALTTLMPLLKQAETRGFLSLAQHHWRITPLGRRFTNDLQSLFLP